MESRQPRIVLLYCARLLILYGNIYYSVMLQFLIYFVPIAAFSELE